MYFREAINTDVLIIGSGGAGLCAAISARKEGADVLVLSKTRPGRANNTAISGGAYAVSTGLRSVDDTPALHIRDTIASGRRINRPEMVQTVAEGALEQTQNLTAYGVPLRRRDDGGLWIVHAPGHSVPRHVFSENSFGTDFTLPLSRYARDLGVDFLSGVFVERLCRDKHGRIAGALILDPQHEDTALVRAKAIVLAAGGAGQIYSHTNNALGTTGDGYALAFRLGVPLMDMEFVQYYPTLLAEPSLPRKMIAYEVLVFRGGAKLFNAEGDDIALRHGMDDPGSMTRDALTLAIAKEGEKGRGGEGGVWMDISTMPSERLERYKKFIPKTPGGKTRFLVSPAVHFFMGGLSVSSMGETGVQGLYAAGEVNGGVHGANRLAGNALTEVWVFGNLTGILAAQYASGIRQPQVAENLEAISSKIRDDAEGGTGFQVRDVRKEFQETMWKKAGIIRREEKLAELVSGFESINKKLSECGARDWKELIKILEMKNMLLVGEAVARSALLRKESRGSHYREEFQKEGGDAWVKNTMVRVADKEMEVELDS